MATNTYAVSHLASPLDKIIGMKFQNTLQTQKPISNLFNWVNATERNQIYPIQISRNGDAGVKTE